MFDRHRLLLLFAATCLLLASGAAAAEGDAFTATSTPSHIKPSTLTAYTVTLTNSGTSTKEADRAKIAIPAGFAVDGTTFQATTSAAGQLRRLRVGRRRRSDRRWEDQPQAT